MRLRVHTAVALVGAVGWPLLVLGMVGCGGDKVTTYEPTTDPAQLYMRLTLNHAAITMAPVAPYDTLQLVATPLDGNGVPMVGLPAPTFTSSDTFSVRVDANGLLTARQAAEGVSIIAELTAAGNLRHADTAIVNVSSGPPTAALDTLSIHPLAPADSAIWQLSEASSPADSFAGFAGVLMAYAGHDPYQSLNLSTRLRVLDAAHEAMPGVVVEYFALDPDIAELNTAAAGRWSGQVSSPFRVGRARMVARATAYGVTKADTVTFTVMPPASATIPIYPTASATGTYGATLRIRPNGIVAWLNTLDQPVDLVFDDPTHVAAGPMFLCDFLAAIPDFFGPGPHCQAGNTTFIAPAQASRDEIFKTVQVQQFTDAGVYDYHIVQTGVSGRIVVTDGSSQ